MRPLICISAMFLLLPCESPAQRREPAQDLWERGVKLYQAGDLAGASKLILAAAQAGNSLAQTQIGLHYEKGIGLAKNYAEAARWYRRGAENGDSLGMKNLGQMYEEGKGVPEDWVEATKWYAKSAGLENKEGEAALARAYQFGIGVPQNRKTSILWDQRAAALGDSTSAHYARWLRDPTNNIGFRNDQERDLVMAGKLRFGVQLIGGDPAGILFRNSTERFAWLLLQRKELDKDEADTWWQIRKQEYDRCRNNREDYCREPGPRPR
ncbi:MAG TPA: tetratricopeptide repeat protein [Bryobacteraceae bacterium]|nr:tetratricopeptide repeat protein [Bryobacteraceae bacterium]